MPSWLLALIIVITHINILSTGKSLSSTVGERDPPLHLMTSKLWRKLTVEDTVNYWHCIVDKNRLTALQDLIIDSILILFWEKPGFIVSVNMYTHKVLRWARQYWTTHHIIKYYVISAMIWVFHTINENLFVFVYTWYWIPYRCKFRKYYEICF